MPPLGWLFVGVLITCTAPLLVKLALGEASPIAVATHRMVIASAIIVPVAWLVARPAFARFDRRRLVLSAAAGLLLALSFTIWMASMTMTSVASSVVLATTMPLWVALASPFTTGDPLTPRTLLGVGVAIVGAAVIGGGDGFASATVAGNTLALVSAMTNGAHRLVGRVVRERVPLLPYVAVVYPTAAVALVLAALLTSQRMDGFGGDTYLWMVLLALGPQVLGHSLYNWALGRLTAITVTSGIMTEPVFSVGLAAVVLRDAPTATQVAGAALVLVGVFITVRAQQAAAAQAAAAVPAGQPA